MTIDLHQRPIVITGGGSGIGAATAVACAAAGMPVVLAGRRLETLESVRTRIEADGGHAAVISLDVTDIAHAARVLDFATEQFGVPWAVFANAGRGLDRPAHRTTDEEMRAIFEVNYFAAHRLLSQAAARMIAGGHGGHLLASASCVSKFAPPYHGAYAATKASIDLLCQAMRLELSPLGIYVSTVHPITTITDFFDESARVSGRSEHSCGLHHTPRLLQQKPERVAKAIVKCLRHPRPEVWTSTLVRMVSAVRTVMPKLMDRQFRRMVDITRTQESGDSEGDSGGEGGSGRTSIDHPASVGSTIDNADR